MPRLPRITATEVLRRLHHDGWLELPGSGTSHVKLRHPTKRGYVTVAVHTTRVIPPGTLSAILNQADLTVDQFRRL